jgi:Immunoglobulin V-set domain.
MTLYIFTSELGIPRMFRINQPAEPVYTLNQGLAFELDVEVTPQNGAVGVIEYQWYRANSIRSSVPLRVGLKTKSLNIKSVQNSDSGSYFCVVKLDQDVQKSESIELVINCE